MAGKDAAEQDTKSRGASGLTRRRFIALSCGFAASTAFLTLATPALSSLKVIRPPGVVDEESLSALCIGCERCADACPTRGITPSSFGESRVGTPVLTGYCAVYLELVDPNPFKNTKFRENGSKGERCSRCIEACPTGALQPVGLDKVKMGIAEMDVTRCLWWRHDTCRRCLEICPVDAVRVTRGNRPRILEDVCIGCAQCVYVCPLEPKAVVVRPVDAEPVFR